MMPSDEAIFFFCCSANASWKNVQHVCHLMCVCVLRGFGTRILLTLYRYAQFQMILVKKHMVTNVLNFTNWNTFDQTSVPLITTPKKMNNPIWDTKRREHGSYCARLECSGLTEATRRGAFLATANVAAPTFKTYFLWRVELHTIVLKQLPQPRYLRVFWSDCKALIPISPVVLVIL